MKRKLSTTFMSIAAAAAVAFAGVPGIATAMADAPGDVVTLNLYNLTDVHGHIELAKHYKTKKITEAGLAAVGCYLEKARADHPDSSFTLLGDNTGASPFTSGILYDNPTIAALNKLNPVASTLGNHELDLGQDVFKARVKGAKATVRGDEVQFEQLGFPYLAANVEGLEGLGSYKVWEAPSGVKVAFIGAIAEDVPYKLSPGTTKGMTFNDPIAKINALAKELKDSGKANVVIAMLDDDTKNNYPKMGKYVDGLMGGDTHVPYDFDMVDGAEGNKLSATASGSYTDNISNLVVEYNKATGKVVKSHVDLIPAAEVAKCDVAASATGTAIKAVVDKAKTDSKKAGEKVVAKGFTKPFKRAVFNDGDGKSKGAGSNRGHESTLGDLIADALRDQIKVQGADHKSVDIGIINAGGIREDLEPKDDGTLSYAQTFAVMPFSNELGYVTLTGAQFKKALEQQWKTNLNSQNSRPMLKLGISSNVHYTYDPAKPYGERITSIIIDGKPMDMAKNYTVGSVTFLLDGGDSFDALTENGKPVTNGDLDRDGFNEYLAKGVEVAQPETAKRSVGITLPEGVVPEDGAVKVSLRGLSFTEGDGVTENATVKIGEFESVLPVDNDLSDANANDEAKAVITTDGAGQAEGSFAAAEICKANKAEDKELTLPVEVSSIAGNPVSAAQGLTVTVKCAKEAKPEADKPAKDQKPGKGKKPGKDGKAGKDKKPGKDGKAGKDKKPGKDGKAGNADKPGNNGKNYVHKNGLANTGSSAATPIALASLALALMGGGALVLRRRNQNR